MFDFKRSQLFNEADFRRALSDGNDPLPLFRRTITTAQRRLDQAFLKGSPVAKLVAYRSWLVDRILIHAWRLHGLDKHTDVSLIAVGGYGRSELLPHSDIDLLLLADEQLIQRCQTAIEKLISFLWDIGLQVSNSVRSLAQCEQEAKQDLTVITSLIDSRLIYGRKKQLKSLIKTIAPDNIWNNKDFFHAKCEEQATRHKKYNNTSYHLEPNVKTTPGGLRDIQIVQWVATRYFGPTTIRQLMKLNFLTMQEYKELTAGRHYLWQIRYALHLHAKRKEDRLLFGHQLTLSKTFGYHDMDNELAVEQFMKVYYRTIKSLNELNDMLLQLFREAIIFMGNCVEKPLNKYFQIRNDYIEVINDNIFKKHPEALLEIFLQMTYHPEIKGVRATTIRLIRQHRHLVDDAFRHNPVCKKLFLALLQLSPTHKLQLRRMNRYGILGKYIPEFDHVIGLMQFDLHHVYTVDQHIIVLAKQLQQFRNESKKEDFPLCAAIMAKREHHEILFLTAIFHDIAKGTGGEHSAKGAKIARYFCQQHNINPQDTDTICWLIENHLLYSETAQRLDIYDPDVINTFASQVQTQERLDLLYAFTVADIKATNKTLWNSWRESLFKQLYDMTNRAIPRYLKNPIEQSEIISQVKSRALTKLLSSCYEQQTILSLWEQWGNHYFLRDNAANIINHTMAILNHRDSSNMLVSIQSIAEHGGTEIFLYLPDKKYLFVQVTTELDRLGLNIVDAHINTTKHGYALDSFTVLNRQNQLVCDERELQHIKQQLQKALAKSFTHLQSIKRYSPNLLRYFTTQAKVTFSQTNNLSKTRIEISGDDQPGLLASISHVFVSFELRLYSAKIDTQANKIHDIFIVTDSQGKPITNLEQQTAIKNAIVSALQLNSSR